MTKAHIVSFMGAPGVGKTHLANQLSQRQGIYFFDRDTLLDNIFGNDRESEHYRNFTGGITKSTWVLASENARRGVSSILESPMTGAIQGKNAGFIDDALQDGQKEGFSLSLIYCKAPAEVVLARLKSRADPRDNPKYDNWQQFCDTFLNVPGPAMNISL